MYSFLALLCTLTEVGAAIAGYVMHSEIIFYNTVIYGSPFYLVQHAIGPDSLLAQKPMYWAFCVFHLFKYVTIIQAQRLEDRNAMRAAAVLLEAAYLIASTIYLL